MQFVAMTGELQCLREDSGVVEKIINFGIFPKHLRCCPFYVLMAGKVYRENVLYHSRVKTI